MPKAAKPTKQFIEECFNYNPETGDFLWRERPRHHFRTEKDWSAWNRRYPGKVPGYIREDIGRNRPRTVVLSSPDWGDFRGFECVRACAMFLGYEVTEDTFVHVKNGDQRDLRGENIWVMQPIRDADRLEKLTLSEFLHECFDADYEAGTLTWKVRPSDHFKGYGSWWRFNKTFPGRRAENETDHGYFNVNTSFKKFFPHGSMPAHRAIWAMKHGEIDPSLVIDHINGKPDDNRIENLRLVTKAENGLNRKNKKRKSGLSKNINKIKGGYNVSFGVSAGNFTELSDAERVAMFASRRWFGEFSRQHGGEVDDYEGEPLAIKVRRFLSGEIDEIVHKKKAAPVSGDG